MITIDRPVRDLLRRRMRLVQQRTAVILSLEALFTVQEQMDLIALLAAKIKRFEATVLETARLQPSFEILLSIPGIGTILALTIMLETGDINRFKKVGNYSS